MLTVAFPHAGNAPQASGVPHRPLAATICRALSPTRLMPVSTPCCSADPVESPRSRSSEQIRDRMLKLVYDELRRLARGFLARERSDHTLQPTALVHEAYLRLIDQRQVDWTNRAQFVGVAAVMMRRILVNHARERATDKRGGDLQKVPLSDVDAAGAPQDVDVIALHSALDQLETIDQRKSRIVELKFFGGLTTNEIAEVLHISPATIERDW